MAIGENTAAGHLNLLLHLTIVPLAIAYIVVTGILQPAASCKSGYQNGWHSALVLLFAWGTGIYMTLLVTVLEVGIRVFHPRRHGCDASALMFFHFIAGLVNLGLGGASVASLTYIDGEWFTPRSSWDDCSVSVIPKKKYLVVLIVIILVVAAINCAIFTIASFVRKAENQQQGQNELAALPEQEQEQDSRPHSVSHDGGPTKRRT